MKVTESLTGWLRLHEALEVAGLPHAFGGALALAWCTGNGRGTIDIDVNIFVAVDRAEDLRSALPSGVVCDGASLEVLVRLDWSCTPLDIFLNTTEIHAQAARCVSWEQFAGHCLPFLSCFHVALFKAFFNRTKDWADLEAMRDAGTLDVERVRAALINTLATTSALRRSQLWQTEEVAVSRPAVVPIAGERWSRSDLVLKPGTSHWQPRRRQIGERQPR